ncbi:deoxyribodipyrimidine photo-lyase [Hydrogenophaga sp. IBVHS2]|uniref:cryptochrome/photolyase family protein n=1 Tax=Hydrogenophaga sp. IBVHS2 TaxID=1985170 RepID=UPI000A2E8357|nr:deoxyribodipyrimidine photo-lyase [Hydrogenophaga sp. IBVHS2]OSZ64682.1 deoxyribodipyrimidine photolyase [Hydrogenophaga sp. IBVHS2]
MQRFDSGLMWFRRDLRASDNTALHHALASCRRVWCVFVFDRDILDPLPRADRRVEFIRESLVELDARLREMGQAHGVESAGLIVLHDTARSAIPALAQRLGVQAVFTNHDDEPAALARDARVLGDLAHAGIILRSFKDHVIFERREVLTQAGGCFGVFTPYKNAWLKALRDEHLKAWPVEPLAGALAPRPAEHARPVPTLQDIGFEPTNLAQLPMPTGARGAQRLLDDFVQRIDRYQEARDFPAIKGPSYLSVHLRFGTVSVRQLASLAWPMHLQGMAGASNWLSELIWRDFYHQIMANFPHVTERAFKPEYDRIAFEHGARAEALFQAWCEGRTGYPLVDAAMAQINQTGYMHNRLRMVVASFLVKDLGLHWQWGERYFAEKLIDFDLAANNGGWQWASSSGCDAQPYFRIFNPVSQSEKFDAQGRFIRRYLPQLEGLSDKSIHAPWAAPAMERLSAGVELGVNYPHPVVDHALAREKTLERYAVVKKAA